MRRAALLTTLGMAMAGTVSSQAPDAGDADVYLHAGRLLADPSTGTVDVSKTIVVGNGRVREILDGFVRPGPAPVVDLREAFVLPGLIDSHVHITSQQGPARQLERFTKSVADAAIDGAWFARITLEAGFTTVADLHAPAEAILALRDGIARGRVPGPRIIASAGSVTPHGGHSDANAMPFLLASVLRSALP